MRAALATMAATVPLLGLGACGGGGSPGAATPVNPRAIVIVSQTSTGLVGYSAKPEYQLCLRLPVEIRETSGVGLNMNYVRLQLYRDSAEVERAEVTAEDFVTLAGSNRVEARAVMAVTLDFFFNELNFDRGGIVVGATDDYGNSIDFVLGSLEVEFYEGVLAEAGKGR